MTKLDASKWFLELLTNPKNTSTVGGRGRVDLWCRVGSLALWLSTQFSVLKDMMSGGQTTRGQPEVERREREREREGGDRGREELCV